MAGLVVTVVLGASLVVLLAGARGGTRPIELALDDKSLHVKIRGKDAIFALCRGMTIPIESVKGVCVLPSDQVPRTGLRLPGTGIPGALRAGSFGTGQATDFWLVRQAQELLVIELNAGEPYRRIVLEVTDPRAEARRLRPVLGA